MRPIFAMVAHQRRQQTHARSSLGIDSLEIRESPAMDFHGERWSILEPEQSAVLREKLLTEVRSVASPGTATIWAQEALAAKNRLAAADAKLVEDGFERRLSELAPSATAQGKVEAAPSAHVEVVGAPETLAKENGDLDQPRPALSRKRRPGFAEPVSTATGKPGRCPANACFLAFLAGCANTTGGPGCRSGYPIPFAS
jgi:hypothetical protein